MEWANDVDLKCDILPFMKEKRLIISKEAASRILDKAKASSKVYGGINQPVIKLVDLERIINKITKKDETDV